MVDLSSPACFLAPFSKRCYSSLEHIVDCLPVWRFSGCQERACLVISNLAVARLCVYAKAACSHMNFCEFADALDRSCLYSVLFNAAHLI